MLLTWWQPFRRWRRTRPFWGGCAVIAGGTIMLGVPLAPLPVMMHVGTAAVSGVAFGLILIVAGLFFWFAPQQRTFVAVVSVIVSLASFVTTNLGGLGFGMLLGLLGSSMAFGWRPYGAHAPRTRRRIAEVEPADDDPVADERAASERAADADALTEELPALPRREARPGALAALLIVVVAVTALVAAGAPAPAAAAPRTTAACPGDPADLVDLLFPWLPRPADPCPTPTPSIPTTPGAPTPIPGLPIPGAPIPGAPTPGGAAPSPGATPGGTPTPTPSASGTAPPAASDGSAPDYRVAPDVSQVSATKLDATGFTFRGATTLPTTNGPLKVLVFHADRLVADAYRIRTTAQGPVFTLGVDLDISDVEIYATGLAGTVTVPYLDVPLLPISITAAIIPTWLPLNITLPLFSGRDVTAGQVLIRAGTVNADGLEALISAGGA